ncbi:hypothetical protein M0812_27558 [Anaeramoeba flamelloides]|uniref:Uncharacterized protein n=1 Tax=Anaeramoeba flamelloides TaxID=1746091 RepID=A0AAV7YCC2_9EUKA|nr:hypothetical protein M0812_27558 [Anaeramoeba flamelloides]
MADVLLIHGFNINSFGIWYPWLRDQLEEKGDFTVHIPSFPKPSAPLMSEWIDHLSEEMFGTDSTRPLIIIGHSLGGYFVQRILENTLLDNKQFWKDRLVQVYLVAATGFRREKATNFYEPEVDWEKINENTKNVQFHIIWDKSDNVVPQEHCEYIHKNCNNSTLHILNNQNKHFLSKSNNDLLQLFLQNN